MNDMDYLQKYKPSLPDLFKDFTISEDLPKPELAFKTYELLLVAKRSSESMFLIIGKLLKDIKDNKLYEQLDYPSFGQFLASEEVGYSRESAYLFIRSYEYLIDHLQLNPDAVGKMNIGRINMMIPVLKRIEAESGKEEAIKQIEEFDSLRHGDFVQKIREEKKTSRPEIYWSEEEGKWICSYWEDMTVLKSRGVMAQDAELI